MKNGKSNLIRDLIELIVVIAVWGILFYGFLVLIKTCATETVHHAEKKSAEAAVVSEEAILTAQRYAEERQAESEIQTVLKVYTEGTGAPAPSWFKPNEEMAIEWTEDDGWTAEASGTVARDIGCPDWNLNTTLWGWDGHSCEVWEMTLFSRIIFLEFYGTSESCCIAGVDSVLNLWASGYFGNSLGGLLSATAENGALVYTTYGWVWDEISDTEGLAWCYRLCEERFYHGPTSGNQAFFQLYGYPWWAQPCFEIDGVYFSTGKGW